MPKGGNDYFCQYRIHSWARSTKLLVKSKSKSEFEHDSDPDCMGFRSKPALEMTVFTRIAKQKDLVFFKTDYSVICLKSDLCLGNAAGDHAEIGVD